MHLKFTGKAARQMLSENMAEFTQLSPYIDGLFFDKYPITGNLAKTLTAFKSLQALQLYFLHDAKILADIPTLREIYAYWDVDHDTYSVYRTSVMSYASSLPKLKKIYIRDNSQKRSERFQFDCIDVVRKELAGACKLKIHVRADDMFHKDAKIIQGKYDNIEVERVESEEVENPLVTEHLSNAKVNHRR